MNHAKVHKKVTLRHRGWDVEWQCSSINDDIIVWHDNEKANWGFNTVQDAIDWMEERIEYLYPNAERYPETNHSLKSA